MTCVFDSFTGGSLDVIGRVEYGILRFPSESDDSYRGRLKNVHEARKRAYLGAVYDYCARDAEAEEFLRDEACTEQPRWDTPSAPLDAETLQQGFESLRRGPQRISDVVSVSVELTNVPAPSDVADFVRGTWTPDERACVDCHHFTYFGFDPWCNEHERCTKNGDCCSEWSARPPKIAESNGID